MKMINVGPMRIPADQLPTLAKILGATITTEIPESNGALYYLAKDGKIYDKKCYNCVVEWLDDQCSTEQARCNSCIVNDVYTQWEIDQWRLDNNQLHSKEEV